MQSATGGSVGQARPSGDLASANGHDRAYGTPTTAAALPSSFGLALTLGGGAVRLLDLTAAYAAFAERGPA